MKPQNRAKAAFSLVELLVVIAIIAILAAALFPAINSAMQSARATSMKANGRAIWMAIAAANATRDAQGECYLWPKDLHREVDGVGSCSAYFTYLLSDGATISTIAKAPAEPLVKDLARESFAAHGVRPNAALDKIDDGNNAWSVAVVGDNNNPADALFVSRNVNFAGGKVTRADAPGAGGRLEFSKDVRPFGNERAVWITRGGVAKDVRDIYVRTDMLFATMKDVAEKDEDDDPNNTVDVWQNKGGK